MTGRRHDLDMVVQPMLLAAHKVGAARFDDREHTFAKRAEFDRRGPRIEVRLVEILLCCVFQPT